MSLIKNDNYDEVSTPIDSDNSENIKYDDIEIQEIGYKLSTPDKVLLKQQSKNDKIKFKSFSKISNKGDTKNNLDEYNRKILEKKLELLDES